MHRVFRILSGITIVAGLVLVLLSIQTRPATAQQGAQAKGPQWKDQAEYDMYSAVVKETDPKKKLALINAWKDKYPQTEYKLARLQLYLNAYQQLNDFPNLLATLNEMLTMNPKDLTVMSPIMYYTMVSNDVSPASLDNAQKVANSAIANLDNKPANISDADWQKMQEEAAASAKDDRAFMEYAFFQLLPRVSDANKRVQYLDSFMQAYPDTTNAGQMNFQYFVAYAMLNNMAKADEYGEKAGAADPPNIVALNLVADSYATRQINLDKAAAYAKKALDLATSMKKPEGESDEQFKTEQNNALGLAHLTLGYVAFQRASKTKKVGPAIQDLSAAADLLKANPEFQGKALYLLGNAYEFEYPPNHRLAIDALTRAAGLQSTFAAPSRDLLAKVKKAAGQ